MKASKPWLDALNVKFQDYEEWTTQVSEDQSITYWALDKGKLRVQDYLHWAREHYQIPVLKDSYFRDEANADLYQQMRSVANWSAEMIPLDQWDGVVYIACVEPPVDVNWSFPVAYVLASARTLKKFFNDLEAGAINAKSAGSTTNSEPSGAPPPPPNHLVVEPESIDVPEGMSLETSTTPADSDFETPEGLNFNQSPSASDPASDAQAFLGSESPEGLEDFSQPASPLADLSIPLAEEPEGMDINIPTDVSLDSSAQLMDAMPTTENGETIEDSEPEDLMASDQAPQMESEIEYETEENNEDQQSTSSAVSVIEEFVAPEPTHQPASENAPTETSDKSVSLGGEDFGGNTKTHFGITITGLNKAAPEGAVVDLDKDLPKSLDEAENENEIVAWAFNELKQSFSNSMLLLCEGEQLKPWKWENLWSPSTEKAFEPIEVSKPSVFRIVSRTKQVYHGFVVDSPANKDFFQIWGYHELPKHATLVPVKYESHMVGVMLCVGEETSNTDMNLTLAERTVGEMSTRLKDFLAKAA